jgi:hypothetical protein
MPRAHLEEPLLLVGRKKFEKPLKGHEQYVCIAVLQIRSRQKIGTDHFQQ